MVALGENLRADEDIGVSGALEQIFEPVPRAHGVAIHAQNARLRKFFPEHQLDPLRPASERSGSSWCSGKNFRRDRKSTRLNSSHGYISYAVFCLKKKKTYNYTGTRSGS